MLVGTGKAGLWGELESEEESEDEIDDEDEEEDEDESGETPGITVPPGEIIQPIEKSVVDLGGLVTPISG